MTKREDLLQAIEVWDKAVDGDSGDIELSAGSALRDAALAYLNSDERNPVLTEAEGQWHKFVLLLMQEHGVSDFEITEQAVARLSKPPKTIILDARGGKYWLRSMTQEQAEAFARGAKGKA